jgi:hypothetical protein
MRVTANYLRRLIAVEIERTLSEGRFLFEEEEEKDAGGDEPTEDLFGDDEGGDDEGGDEGDTAGGGGGGGGGSTGAPSEGEEDEPGEDEEAEEEPEEEEEEEPPEPTGPTGDELDGEINTAMLDFEKNALEVAAAKSNNEGRTFSIARFLFEAEDEEDSVIDIPTFAEDTARLISNYDTLIDMEQAIYTKAVDFVTDKYGDDAGDELRDILSRRYGIDLEHENDPEADEFEVYAAGATSGGGAA